VTGLIDRLAKGGHVRRQRDESDRRVIHVGLTKKGQQIFKRLNEHFTRKLGQFLEALDASDRKDLFRILQKVLDRAHRPLAANESHSRG
jgi:DNA-binding MarR family transcriptional regulator